MDQSDYAVIIDGLTKVIGNTRILSDLNIKIKKGKVTALLGPNGAGKTTTIRVILGLLTPQTGNVNVLGIDATKNAELIRKRVGLLPQGDAGYKSLSARENLEFLIKLTGKSVEEIEDELNILLNRLDLFDIYEQNFGTLSGGERRALGFIRAILTGDDLLILDEPTTGLDLARASSMRKIIQEQVNSGKTVLMSSHVITDLEELAEEIIIMRDGTVEKSGTRYEIQEFYAPGDDLEQAIVAAFTGKSGVTQ